MCNWALRPLILVVATTATYIAFRILQGVPVYDIARNCRTNVAMIENHYARFLSPRLLTGLNKFKSEEPQSIGVK